MELQCGGTDELTTLPKRAMCFVEIILIQRDSRLKLYLPVCNTSIASKLVGRRNKKVVVAGAMEGSRSEISEAERG